MSNAIFSFPVEAGTRGSVTKNSKTIAFGDGYEHEVAFGINNRKDVWDVSFSGPNTEVGPIAAFLDQYGTPDSFLWSPPNRPQARYKCRAYSISAKVGTEETLSAVFERDFRP